MGNDKWDPNRMFILVHRLAEQGAEGGDRVGLRRSGSTTPAVF